jgi:hypothetical protein
MTDLVGIYVDEAWMWIERTALWNVRYASVEEYKLALDFEFSIQPIIEKRRRAERRLVTESNAVQENWSISPVDIFPPDSPHRPDVNLSFLRPLRELSLLSADLALIRNLLMHFIKIRVN